MRKGSQSGREERSSWDGGEQQSVRTGGAEQSDRPGGGRRPRWRSRRRDCPGSGIGAVEDGSVTRAAES